MTKVPDTDRRWRKSTFSSQGGDCVEIDGTIRAVRDSKNPGQVLSVDVRGLIAALRSGQPT